MCYIVIPLTGVSCLIYHHGAATNDKVVTKQRGEAPSFQHLMISRLYYMVAYDFHCFRTLLSSFYVSTQAR